MKRKKIYFIIISLCLLAASCRQDPIFYIIAKETVPQRPRIEGAPTNMVVFYRDYPDREEPVPIMYVASGRLHWYARASDSDEARWDLKEYEIKRPKGKIISLAATDDRLYAVCMDGHGVSATLRYIERNGEDNEWKDINSEAADYPVIQSIYAASADPVTTVDPEAAADPETTVDPEAAADPEATVNSGTTTTRLFIGAGTRSQATYAILYLDNNDTLQILKDSTSILSGAVYKEGAYYLSTRGDGIFQISENALDQNTRSSIQQLNDNSDIDEKDKKNNRTFMGMIRLEDENKTIIAVERNGGALYEVQSESDSFARMNYDLPDNNNGIATGKYATGALALWEDYLDPGKKLLIAGIQGGLYTTSTSSYTHGYVEFDLNSNGSFNKGSLRHDPGSLQSVLDNDRYTTSIGKNPVNHLFQSPKDIDPNMTFFASTQTAGLWSYRNRPDNGGLQWNAEN